MILAPVFHETGRNWPV